MLVRLVHMLRGPPAGLTMPATASLDLSDDLDARPCACSRCARPRPVNWCAAFRSWLCAGCRDIVTTSELLNTQRPEGWTAAVSERVPTGEYRL